jgi:hypothetical protein
MVDVCWMVLEGESDSAGAGAGTLFQTIELELLKKRLDKREQYGKES